MKDGKNMAMKEKKTLESAEKKIWEHKRENRLHQ